MPGLASRPDQKQCCDRTSTFHDVNGPATRLSVSGQNGFLPQSKTCLPATLGVCRAIEETKIGKREECIQNQSRWSRPPPKAWARAAPHCKRSSHREGNELLQNGAGTLWPSPIRDRTDKSSRQHSNMEPFTESSDLNSAQLLW